MGSIFQIILQRLALGLLTLLIVSMVIFVAVNALPGDFAQAILGQGATQEAVAQIRADLGLDQNYFMRYFSWLGNVLTGNLGISFAQMNFASNMGGDQLVGVVEQIAPRFKATMFWLASPQCSRCQSRSRRAFWRHFIAILSLIGRLMLRPYRPFQAQSFSSLIL